MPIFTDISEYLHERTLRDSHLNPLGGFACCRPTIHRSDSGFVAFGGDHDEAGKIRRALRRNVSPAAVRVFVEYFGVMAYKADWAKFLPHVLEGWQSG